MAGVGRTMIAPLLVLNLIMYLIVIGFASWNLNHYINGETNHPGVAGNGATFYFLVFAILAGVVGAASKLAGVHHVRSWGAHSLAAGAASALIAWAITALAFGLACKEIHIGGYRGVAPPRARGLRHHPRLHAAALRRHAPRRPLLRATTPPAPAATAATTPPTTTTSPPPRPGSN
ncbi:hypothetical protein OsJ_18362 [Oryza sativa Japonica Group]|uniref:Uncharacterized protein n=1 Tax=Oryza sativa subsp. japonica TaxID=39947 RepID=B9FHU4_ORYSJ|nr:hypothetical protein OsJ_18362 [Oryza sativa Japonica Group]